MMWRRLGITLMALAALTGCATTPVEAPPPPASPAPLEPASPTPMPIPTVRGGTGPLGLVHVNQTLYDPASGMRVTVSEATTGKLSGAAINPKLANGFPQVFALRVTVDATESATHINVNYTPEAGNAPFYLATPGSMWSATCWTLSSRMITDDPRKTVRALAAIGGDVAYDYDPVTQYGDGWVVCPIVNTDDGDYMDEYLVVFDGAAGIDANGTTVGIYTTVIVAVQP